MEMDGDGLDAKTNERTGCSNAVPVYGCLQGSLGKRWRWSWRTWMDGEHRGNAKRVAGMGSKQKAGKEAWQGRRGRAAVAQQTGI